MQHLKLFSLTFTLLLGFSSQAWADWGTQHRVSNQGSYYYTKGGAEVYLQLAHNTTYDLAVDVDGTWYGRNNDATIATNWNDAWLEQTNNNKLRLKANKPGWYKISTAWHGDWGDNKRSITVVFPFNCYLKHDWRGQSNWEFVTMTKKSEEIYTYVATYNGNPTFNCLFGFESIDNSNQGNEITATLVGNPQIGDRCYYEYNLTNNTLTVSKVQWQLQYRPFDQMLDSKNWLSVSFDENNQTTIPNLNLNSMYQIGLYDGVTFYAGAAETVIHHQNCSGINLASSQTPTQLETTYAGGYPVALSFDANGKPIISVTYPESGPAYIFGNFNNGLLSPEYNFNEHDNVIDVTKLKANTDYTFRVFDGGRRCTGATITESTTLSNLPFLMYGSATINTLHTSVAGTYRFKYNQTSHVLEIIYPKAILCGDNFQGGVVTILGERGDTSAIVGDKVLLSATPSNGSNYFLRTLEVYKEGETTTKVPVLFENGGYYFVMPDYNVRVNAVFTDQAVPTTDNHYFARNGFAYSAGMSIAASDITVTISGNSGNLVRNEDVTNWVDPRFTHVIRFAQAAADGNEPTGAVCKFVPTVSGKLTVAVYLAPHPGARKYTTLYVKQGANALTATNNVNYGANEYLYKFPEAEGSSVYQTMDEGIIDSESYGTITFDVVKDQIYYVFCTNAAIGLQGFIFSPDVTAITGARYYTTFYDSRNAYELPEGVKAYAVDADPKTKTAVLVEKFSGDDEIRNILPPDCGVILRPTDEMILDHGEGAEKIVHFRLNYRYTKDDAFDTNVAKPTDNDLKGTDATSLTPAESGNYKYYKLSYNSKAEAGSIGFYWGNATGTVFENGKHKAYLPLEVVAGAPDRLTILMPGEFGPGISTGVEEMSNFQSRKVLLGGKLYIVRENKVFDLNGRLVK